MKNKQENRLLEISDEFLDKIYNLAQNVSQEALDFARVCFFDYLTVTYSGSVYFKDRIKTILEEDAEEGKCHLVGFENTVSCHWAAMINGYCSHTLELDDGHRASTTHNGSAVFSGLLPVAERFAINLHDFLRGVVVGYEVSIKLGELLCENSPTGLELRRAYHYTALCCSVGVAMGICAMRHYTKVQYTRVLSATIKSLSGLHPGSYGCANELKPFSPAVAATAGINAALFCKNIEIHASFLTYFQLAFISKDDDFICKTTSFLDVNVSRPEIFNIYVKPYAACRHCHGGIEAMLDIRREYLEKTGKTSVSASDVKSIKYVGYHGILNRDIKPTSAHLSRMSLSYSAGVALLTGISNHKMSYDEFWQNSEYLSMCDKSSIEFDEALDALVPKMRVTRTTVEFTDGTVLSREIGLPKGEPETRHTKEELFEKALSLVEDNVLAKKIQAFCYDAPEDSLVSEIFDVFR